MSSGDASRKRPTGAPPPGGDELGPGGPRGEGGEGPSEPAYRVGYKRPPFHSRFKAGEPSRNPNGRPRGKPNLKTDLTAELSESISLSQGDRTLRLTKQRALVKSTVAKAIAGDARARDRVFDLVIRAYGLDDVTEGKGSLSEKDAAILAAYVERQTRGQR